METITIPLSKQKLILALAASIVFVVLGAILLIKPTTFVNPVTYSKVGVLIVGIAAIVFFGVAAVTIFKKLFDKRPGLIIDAEGITDNSSGVSAGVITWSQIKGISSAQVQRQRFILLMIDNPDEWLAAQPSSFKKRMMKINYRIYKTPVCISANGLQCDFNTLYSMVREAFAKYGS